MLTIKISTVATNKDPRGGLIICPGCLEDTYIFYAACPECGSDIFEPKHVTNNGVHGRLNYHILGWPEMDKMAHERLYELRDNQKR